VTAALRCGRFLTPRGSPTRQPMLTHPQTHAFQHFSRSSTSTRRQAATGSGGDHGTHAAVQGIVAPRQAPCAFSQLAGSCFVGTAHSVLADPASPIS
jgi:hypothetical protein